MASIFVPASCWTARLGRKEAVIRARRMPGVRWSWRRSRSAVVPVDARATATRPHVISRSSSRRDSGIIRRARMMSPGVIREMEAIRLMSLARRLRVSLPLALLAATILLSCHTLAVLQQSATDSEDADVLPRVLLQAWIPCSHLYGPPLLLALQPCDRLGTLWAAVGFASVCAYAAIMQIVSWPSVVHAFNTTRAALLLCTLLFWGTLFLRYGPAQAVRSLWQRDVRWALKPRATLENLWLCWRGSTITFSAIDVALAMAAVIYQWVDGTESQRPRLRPFTEARE